MNESNSNKIVFLYFKESVVDNGKSLGNRIYRYEWNGTALINPKLILNLPAKYENHNGGKLLIGLEANLYTVIGDQAKLGKLQNVKNGTEANDAGVILRITPQGLPAKGNPFTNISGNDKKMSKYYAYGIRNSFGLAIDPVTWNLWDTENGDLLYDEINLVKPGFNSGWLKAMGPIARINVTANDLVNFPGSRYADPIFSWRVTIGVTARNSESRQNWDNNIPITSSLATMIMEIYITFKLMVAEQG